MNDYYDGEYERRVAHVAGLKTRDNGAEDSLFSVSGRAIVFDSPSLDLGGFTEEIAPEAVRSAMTGPDADYHLLWDHDTTLVLARNKNGTLKSEITRSGVDFWGRVANTSYAADLRVLMDRGDVDECSFAFTIAPDGEEWSVDDAGGITRRVTKISRLWDLTICARGAYPATSSKTERSVGGEKRPSPSVRVSKRIPPKIAEAAAAFRAGKLSKAEVDKLVREVNAGIARRGGTATKPTAKKPAAKAPVSEAKKKALAEAKKRLKGYSDTVGVKKSERDELEEALTKLARKSAGLSARLKRL